MNRSDGIKIASPNNKNVKVSFIRYRGQKQPPFNSVSKSSDKLALNAADGLNDLLAELDIGYENRLEAFRRLSSSNFMK